ncbi:MAG TPA: dipeptide epimerase [Gemmatimonadaceae bacterium]|nr:dipeptide epimerase [Gemmatimonadaceae bacterium]
MKLSHQTIELNPTHPFVIARGGYAHHRNVIVRLIDDDGFEGFGEAAPNRYYGESVATVIAALAQFKPIIERADPLSMESLEAHLTRVLRGNASARSAISSALHDLLGKRLGLPVHRLWGLDASTAPQSSFTIAITENSELEKRVGEAKDYPILKIKLGTDRDMEIVRIIRGAAPQKHLKVDANAAWTPKHAVRMSEFLAEQGVEMLEQPVPANDIEGLRFVRKHSKLPIFADESCLVATDIPKLAGAVDGINIKLAKCGSLREALRMVHVARAHDMQVMAGCMIESSLGISAIAQISPLLDFADFDGAALLSRDPFRGTTITGGDIRLSDGPGLGVEPAESNDLASAFQSA